MTFDQLLERLNAGLACGNTAMVAETLGFMARKAGPRKFAKECGIHRALIYQSLNADGNPKLSTVFKVLDALNLQITARLKPSSESESERR